MRIAVVSTPFVNVPPCRYGGTEFVISELVEGLVARGHDVTLFATGDSHTTARLRYLYGQAQWPPNILHDINHTTWALHQVQRGSYDLVHVHSAGALAFRRWAPQLPLVYTLHHVRDETLSAFYAHFPDVCYVASSADQARREIPLPQVRVIHHGLDPAHFEWTSRPADYVCFVGRFAPIKGPHLAIDAAALAGVPIRVAGEAHDVDREFGEREMKPRLARTHVTYLGEIGMAEKVPLLRDARALLAPISWDEPFGLALIEAMLSGCPVVAFPRGSVPELVEPGLTGFVANDLEEMVELIRPGGAVDRFDRRRCRERAAERFSRAHMVLEYERLYQELLSPARRLNPTTRRIA
jgi:glycosyltransferase involved in cell wall biosynthesis